VRAGSALLLPGLLTIAQCSPGPIWMEIPAALAPAPAAPIACVAGVTAPDCDPPLVKARAAAGASRRALVRTAGSIFALAVDTEDLFVSTADDLLRVPKGGGAAARIGANKGAPCLQPSIVHRGSLLCFQQHTPMRMLRIPRDGGPALALEPFPPNEFVASRSMPIVDGWAYAVLHRSNLKQGEHALVRIPLDGGPLELVVPWGGVTRATLAADATHLYYTSEIGLARRPLSGGPPEALGVSASSVELTGRDVIFATERGIGRIAKGSTRVEWIREVKSPAWSHPVQTIAADDHHVFSIEYLERPQGENRLGLFRTRTDGSRRSTLIARAPEISTTALALDRERVYWAEQHPEIDRGHVVLAMPKDAEVPQPQPIAQ
jgi:hypothetical protein